MPAKSVFLADKLTADFGSALINVLKNPEMAGEQTKAWVAAKAAADEATTVARNAERAAAERIERAVAKEADADIKAAAAAEAAAVVAGREHAVAVRENDVMAREEAVQMREDNVTAREEALAKAFIARLATAVIAELGK